MRIVITISRFNTSPTGRIINEDSRSEDKELWIMILKLIIWIGDHGQEGSNADPHTFNFFIKFTVHRKYSIFIFLFFRDLILTKIPTMK